MLTILRPRGKGKTTELLIESARTGFVLVVSGNQSRQQVMDIAKKMDIEIPKPITYSQFDDIWYHRAKASRNSRYLIDDLDHYFNRDGIYRDVRGFSSNIVKPKEEELSWCQRWKRRIIDWSERRWMYPTFDKETKYALETTDVGRLYFGDPMNHRMIKELIDNGYFEIGDTIGFSLKRINRHSQFNEKTK